jgi:phospholipid transport system substrate-binding protein
MGSAGSNAEILSITRLAMLALSLTLGPTASASALAEGPPSPKPWLKTVVDRGHALARRKVQSGTESESKWREEAKGLIDETLDWTEMTEQSLGREWKKLKPADQTEFSKLLREMIEASYQSKLRMVARGDVKKPEQVKIEWLDEKQEGHDASITARVKTEKNVGVLQFKLKWNDGHWRVWDVAIDEVSTVRTYRTQFAKIIGKDGLAALMERMRNKTTEIREGRAEFGP